MIQQDAGFWVMTHQEIQNPGSERLKARKAHPQILQQADQNFHPKQQTSDFDVQKLSADILTLLHQSPLKKVLSKSLIISLNKLNPKKPVEARRVRKRPAPLRWMWGVLLKPAGMANGSQGTLQHLDVHFGERTENAQIKQLSSEKEKKKSIYRGLTVEFRVELAQVGRDCSYKDLHCSISWADLKASLVSQHRQH